MQIFEFLAFNERIKEISARVDFAVKGKKERRKIRDEFEARPTQAQPRVIIPTLIPRWATSASTSREPPSLFSFCPVPLGRWVYDEISPA